MTVVKTVSIPKEKRPGETRVALLPDEVRRFRDAGFVVYVERDAGAGAGFDDAAYGRVGAEIVSAEEAWTKSPFIAKLFAPAPEEYRFLRPGMHVGGLLHAEGNKALVDRLCESGVTAYSYEYFRAPNGTFPLTAAFSEISGKMAVIYAAYHLQRHLGGSGVLLTATPGARPPKVVVIGYGNAGGAAARLAANLGCEVVVLGSNRERLRQFEATVPTNVRCLLNSREVLEREIPDADVVIGAILISTFDTAPMLDEALVKSMRPGSMIVDVTCGYGSGYMPTFDRFTSHADPTYIRHGVIHAKIDTLPAGVPATATQANSALMAPYLVAMGNAIFDPAAADPVSAAGKVVEGGRVVHPEVRRNMRMIEALEAGATPDALASEAGDEGFSAADWASVSYRERARFYEIEYRTDVDHAYIGGLAEGKVRSALEIPCAVGRNMDVWLARPDLDVVVADIEPEMVRRYGERLKARGGGAHITPMVADMCRMDMGRRFDLIVVPQEAFQLIPGRQAAELALAALRRHLAADGLLMIDIAFFAQGDEPHDRDVQPVYYDPDIPDGQLYQAWVRDLPEGGTLSQARIQYQNDEETHFDNFYTLRRPHEPERRWRTEVRLRRYDADGFMAMLEEAGLRPRAIYRDYDRTPYRPGAARMVIEIERAPD